MNLEQKRTKMKNEFTILSKGFDWGPANHKIVIALEDQLSGTIDKELFSITGEKAMMDWKTREIINLNEDVDVSNAYISNEDGEKVEVGAYICLELVVHPDAPLTSPYSFDLGRFLNVHNQVMYSINLKQDIHLNMIVPSFSLNDQNCKETIFENKNLFIEKEFSYTDGVFGDIKLKYGLFKPDDSRQRPLVVLFHGAGEGGVDVGIALFGNKVISLIGKEIQKELDNAYVLVPQTPDMWMNDGSGNYTKNGTSKYTNAMKALIESVINENVGIDRRRLYVGGGSNGGYMTLNMILNYPKMFAAAFPICEAYASEWILDNQLSNLKSVPIWFIHSLDDTTVHCDKTAKPTFDRLLMLGHKNIHLSVYDGIYDNTGMYRKEDGTPYQYNGHWSWIPVFNNEVKDGDLKLFEWLRNQINEN